MLPITWAFVESGYTCLLYTSRGDVPTQEKFTRFATYMTLFPQLIAGPIVRYRDLADQLGERHQTLARFADGIRILLIGLSKKVLLANSMGALWAVSYTHLTANGSFKIRSAVWI